MPMSIDLECLTGRWHARIFAGTAAAVQTTAHAAAQRIVDSRRPWIRRPPRDALTREGCR